MLLQLFEIAHKALNVYMCLVQLEIIILEKLLSIVVKTLTHVCMCEASNRPLLYALGILISNYTQKKRA